MLQLDPSVDKARRRINWQPAMMLGDGTWIPARPPQADSSWVITPDGWKTPPSFDDLVAVLPVPFLRRLWLRVKGWFR